MLLYFYLKMTQTVCLIIPPSPFLLDERVFVSLGVLKVASSLESCGYKVNLIDLSGIENYLDALSSYVKTCSDIAIGITCTTPQYPAVNLIRNTIKQIRPDLKIILGGPHVTLLYAALALEKKKNFIQGRAHKNIAFLEQQFDVLCSGDGEFAIFEALKPDAPKVVDGDNPKTDLFLTDQTFSSSPYPARHLVDLKSYKYSIEGFNATSLIGQLGCPFNCGFCGGRNSKSLRLIRNRSSLSIVEEIKHLYDNYGYTGFMFYDDELNVNKNMVELMDRITALQEYLGVEFRLRGFVKAELFTEEQAISMYRAGFRWLLCGYEAAHPRILTNINKKATKEDNTNCVKIAKKHGLKVKALMSVGHPGESEETILSIKDWLTELEVEDFDCTVISTYPGTPYYDLAIPNPEKANVWTYTQPKTGDNLHAVDMDYSKHSNFYKGDPNGGYESFVFTDYLNQKEIVELRDLVETEVRSNLGIPFNQSSAALRYEHSMGQGLPDFIYKARKNENIL